MEESSSEARTLVRKPLHQFGEAERPASVSTVREEQVRLELRKERWGFRGENTRYDDSRRVGSFEMDL